MIFKLHHLINAFSVVIEKQWVVIFSSLILVCAIAHLVYVGSGKSLGLCGFHGTQNINVCLSIVCWSCLVMELRILMFVYS